MSVALIVIFLIIAGLFLLVIELLIIPGISVAGIASIVFFFSGIIVAYKSFGSQWGTITLVATIISILVVLYYSLKPETWNKIALKSKIDSKLYTESEEKVNIGDKGKSISRLAPIGEIEIDGNVYEAESIGNFIDPGVDIKVVSKEKNKIFVKPL